MARLRLSAVSKSFAQQPVLQDISLEVGDREFLVLVGASGCGKSTLLRLIAGLESLTTGGIYLNDRPIHTLPPAQRDMAMVFQSYALYPHMTVYENIAFGLRRQQRSRLGLWRAWQQRQQVQQRVHQVAELLHIGALLFRKPKELSGGQKQRVALGRAIARNPQVFLMDEPLSNLDLHLRNETRTQLMQLHRELETTTVYVTHDQTEAMTMGDRLVVLHQGRIQQCDTPWQIYCTPVNRYVAQFVGYPPMNVLPISLTKEGTMVADWLRQPIPTKVAATGDRLLWGVRPEDWQLCPSDEADFQGVVRRIEVLGADAVVDVAIAPTLTVQCKLPTPQLYDRGLGVGRSLSLRGDRLKFHFFDAVTEQRL
jgi:multiple sugar transport system ATP-binding protein